MYVQTHIKLKDVMLEFSMISIHILVSDKKSYFQDV